MPFFEMEKLKEGRPTMPFSPLQTTLPIKSAHHKEQRDVRSPSKYVVGPMGRQSVISISNIWAKSWTLSPRDECSI
uniref:Uncharacterized protein n=1 Tax=Rhizophora mucronata TaxID=61149 RepID=A0A2P2QZX7_RHIMU